MAERDAATPAVSPPTGADGRTGAGGMCCGPQAGVEQCPPGHVDLASLTPSARVEALAAVTARFSASFLRRLGGRSDALTYPRARVLEVLESGGPAIMRDLADALGLTARNITGIVDALEDAELVTRVPHPTDRRATVVEITGKGRSEAALAQRLALDKVAPAFDALSLEDQQHFTDLLERLSAYFCR